MQAKFSKRMAEKTYLSIFKDTEFSRIFSINKEINSLAGEGITITSKSIDSDQSVIFYIKDINSDKPIPAIKFCKISRKQEFYYIFENLNFNHLYELLSFFCETGKRYTYINNMTIKRTFEMSDFFSKPLSGECTMVKTLIADIDYNPAVYQKSKGKDITNMSISAEINLDIVNESVVPSLFLKIPITSKHKYNFTLDLDPSKTELWEQTFKKHQQTITDLFEQNLISTLIKHLKLTKKEINLMSFEQKINALRLIEMITI
jgi:hypothetical protein